MFFFCKVSLPVRISVPCWCSSRVCSASVYLNVIALSDHVLLYDVV